MRGWLFVQTMVVVVTVVGLSVAIGVVVIGGEYRRLLREKLDGRRMTDLIELERLTQTLEDWIERVRDQMRAAGEELREVSHQLRRGPPPDGNERPH